MSDLTIPGVSNKYNTQKIIDALIAVKKEPLKRMEREVDLEKRQKSVWQNMIRRLAGLRDSSRALFGFQNPFGEKIGGSSDEKVLSAAATREAIEETKHILVRQIATPDRFLSRPFSRDLPVHAGEYAFRVGDKEIRFSFQGGSMKEFVDALNKRGDVFLQATIVNDTKDTRVLMVEGKQAGAKNRVAFLGAAADLAVKVGMLERSAAGSRAIAIDEKAIVGWTKPAEPTGSSVREGTLTLNPGAEMKIPLRPPLSLNPNMVLEFAAKTVRIPEEPVAEVKPPPGPDIPETGSIDFKGIRIQSERSKTPLPDWQPPKPPEKRSDLQALFAEGDGKLIALPDLVDSTEFQKVQVPIGELLTALDSLDARNRNTHRTIAVKDIAVFDKTQRGDYVPTRALSEAADALLSMDGIEVRRSSNAVDDLIPGVTLTLKAAGAEPVEVTIKRDVEGIKKQIMTVVGAYNRTITDIDILTRKDERIIEDADYLGDDEKRKARENLGLLFGDLLLQQLKGTMQTVMMNPYPTSREGDLRLLAQIGIATELRTPGSASIDKTKLRGYLEVDEQKLTGEISRHPDAVRQLFGNDTDGDLVVNAGVAYAIDTLLRPYVATGGIVPQRVSNLEARLARAGREIADYNRKLSDYQAELKKKYGQMEGALGTLEKNSQAIQNFNKQNQ